MRLPCSGHHFTIPQEADPSGDDDVSLCVRHLDVAPSFVSLERCWYVDVPCTQAESCDLGVAQAERVFETSVALMHSFEALLGCCFSGVDGGDETEGHCPSSGDKFEGFVEVGRES